jgi:hypothetical protein
MRSDGAQSIRAVDCFGGRRVFAGGMMFIICCFGTSGRLDDVSMRGQTSVEKTNHVGNPGILCSGVQKLFNTTQKE